MPTDQGDSDEQADLPGVEESDHAGQHEGSLAIAIALMALGQPA
jgi:hypothetical protein